MGIWNVEELMNLRKRREVIETVEQEMGKISEDEVWKL